MQKLAGILCAALLALLAGGVLGTQPECLLSENPRHEKFILDESSWELMLEGEWMISFSVPLILDCIRFERVWNKFAMEKKNDTGGLIIASMKLEYSETVIHRFSVHDLPTLLHVKNGVFRKLPIVYSVAELKRLARGQWQDTEPMSFWQHPNGPLTHAYIQYIRAKDAVCQNDWLDMDYEPGTCLVRIALAVVVVLVLMAMSSLYSCIRGRLSACHRLAKCEKKPQDEGKPIQEGQPAIEATASPTDPLSIQSLPSA